MSKNETPELFPLLKQLGFTLENKLNKYIQDKLDHKEVAVAANSAGKVLAHLMEAVHEYVEQLSAQLNFPTKKDVGRLGKLIVQSEDKLDDLEDEIHEVLDMLKDIKKTLLKNLTEHRFEGLDEKLRNELADLIKNPTSHIKEEIVKPLEELEDKLKKRVIKCSKELLKKKKMCISSSHSLKDELHKELMKPPGQVDFQEVNQKLLQLLKEKRKRKKKNG
ncbi:hypothetical protein [Metabacillus sp. B2-18]|uniref:hypothetical protein n=1 Tax=Metabacillus sp. B2-18 TaxID=2897333 RepID=UPI001E4658EB|nr:hypothetical protein [Metabacillus sp. B2-18]UGB29844.1 hypothetical protein LPC09_19175 [Metabacillus sp. B2-18]